MSKKGWWDRKPPNSSIEDYGSIPRVDSVGLEAESPKWPPQGGDLRAFPEVEKEDSEAMQQRSWLLSHVPVGLGGFSKRTTQLSRRGKAYRAEGLNYDELDSVVYEESLAKAGPRDELHLEWSKWVLVVPPHASAPLLE